jgi:hypothetical protein
MRPASDGQLLFVNYQTGDAIREQLVRGLKRQLDGVQAARAKACEPPAAERDAAGDEIGIQAKSVCVSDKSFKIAS